MDFLTHPLYIRYILPWVRAEERFHRKNDRNRDRARFLNWSRRMDAIDAECDHICNELNTLIKLVMESYGFHYHRGTWRRRHVSPEERALQNALIEADRTASSLEIHASAEPSNPSSPGNPIHGGNVPIPQDGISPVPTGGNVSPPSKPKRSKVARSSRRARVSELRPFPALPERRQLPYDPPFHPLFPRAMDGTTFAPPGPPEPNEPYPGSVGRSTYPEPTQEQIAELYRGMFVGPPPNKGACRYSDPRIGLSELTWEDWQCYGGYYYEYFTRRLPKKPPPEPPKPRNPPGKRPRKPT